jgi:ATP-dependent DNA ligase
MIIHKEKIYKIDTDNKIRVWWVECDLEKYRVHSGVLEGKLVTSGWKYPTPKNVGKANETLVPEQVVLEVEALYEKKLNQGNYHRSVEASKKGSKYIVPMLAQTYDKKKHKNFPYIANPKLDGVRCVVSKDGMFSRKGKPFVSCPHISQALTNFFNSYPDTILDGELYNHDLKDDFEKIISLVRKTKPSEEDIKDSHEVVQYHIYDIIQDDCDDGYQKRYESLQEVLDLCPDTSLRIIESRQIESEDDVGEYLFECLEKGYEGAMLRCPSTPYEPKRSKSLLKVKTFEDAEFEIVDIIEGVGNWQGYAKSLEILLPDGSTQNSGMKGSQDFAKNLLLNRDFYIGTDVTVRFQEKTNDGKLRFPVAVKFWGRDRDC